MRTISTTAIVVLGAVLLGGCSEPLSPSAERGRLVYLAQCATCHAANPAAAGPVGPAVRGASRDLLEAKVVHGTYPPGYRPKRPTSAMPPMPHVAQDIDALTEFLSQRP